MKILMVSLLLLSTQAFALDWSEFEIGHVYSLDQKIVFEEDTQFERGEKFAMIDFFPINGNVMYVDMAAEDCKMPEATGEMILVNPTPDDTTVDRSVGVTLDKECHLGLFIEVRDIYSKSLFE